MKLLKLKPAVVSAIWGGNKLRKYGKVSSLPNIAETWELSFNESHPSLLKDGTPLKDAVSKKELGTLISNFDVFPMLTKFIDAEDNLSVQVHPNDEFAYQREGKLGKIEMWHILEAEEGAGIYLGFKEDSSKEELLRKIEDGTVLEMLNFFAVSKGDTYLIPPGTIHAIGKGVTLIEIQENSDVTYRLYDYQRKDADGNPRELHVEKALQVIDFKKYQPVVFDEPILGKSKYFETSLLHLSDNVIEADFTSFKAIHFISGQGKISCKRFNKGDTFFLQAGKKVRVRGNADAIIVKIPE